MIAEMAGQLQPPRNIEFEGPDGKTVRMEARVINLPQSGPIVIDLSGNPVPVAASKIRAASTTAPRTPTFTHGEATADRDMKLPDGSMVKKGQVYTWRQANEEGAKREITGAGRQPQPRPGRATPQETAANRKLDRQIATLDAIGKVMQQTIAKGGFVDNKGNLLEGAALARAIPQQISRFYKDDPSVMKYLPDITNWVNEEARKGSLKGDIVNNIQTHGTQLQQEKEKLQTSQKLDAIQNQLYDSMFGDTGGGSSITIDPDK